MEVSNCSDLSLYRLRKAQREVVRFDVLLDELQQLFPDSEQMCDFINNTRDCLHRLQQVLRGEKIIDYSKLSEEPWI